MTIREQIEQETNRQFSGQHPFLVIAGESFKDGAEFGYNLAIEKAMEWFTEHWREYIFQDKDGVVGFINWKNDFKKEIEI
jgi:hypothetical protein